MQIQTVQTQSYAGYPALSELQKDIGILLLADAVSPNFLKKLRSILSCLDIARTWTAGGEYLDEIQQTIWQTLDELRRTEDLPQTVDQRVVKISKLLSSQQILNPSQ